MTAATNRKDQVLPYDQEVKYRIYVMLNAFNIDNKNTRDMFQFTKDL